jgi:hypothetical protein
MGGHYALTRTVSTSFLRTCVNRDGVHNGDMDNPIQMLQKRKAGRTLREVAAEVPCSIGYLSDVLRGRRDPAGKILAYLGIERQVKYVRRKADAR